MKKAKNEIRFFNVLRIGLMVIIVWCAGKHLIIAQATGSSCTVDVSGPGAEVAPICRGQQIEEFNYQFQGGLYAQLINNPSFEELDESNNELDINQIRKFRWQIDKSDFK